MLKIGVPGFLSYFNLTFTDCLNRAEYEYGLEYESAAQFAAEERTSQDSREVVTDHPFLALKKLLGDGSFYYSLDFNLTDRLQDRYAKCVHSMVRKILLLIINTVQISQQHLTLIPWIRTCFGIHI